jgi:DNA-binding transcriptional MerR regulator
MLRIGETAKMYDISNRTLRYWEEMGILKSERTENDYRYYNDENVARIKQIVLLRKLKMPISEIERVFIASDFSIAIDALSNHLENLKKDANAYMGLIANVEALILHIKNAKDMKQVFSCLEANNITDLKHSSDLKINLFERTTIMSKENLNNVRIVKIPVLTVASYRAESESPENDCSKVFNKFVLENNLHKRDGYRNLGFNNPSPTEGNPVYGYEIWVTIPDDFDVPQPLVKKHFAGGQYASISTYMNEIGERWMQLNKWCENNDKYEIDFSVQWLEECTMDFEMFISDTIPDGEKQLDLLQPIKLKG